MATAKKVVDCKSKKISHFSFALSWKLYKWIYLRKLLCRLMRNSSELRHPLSLVSNYEQNKNLANAFKFMVRHHNQRYSLLFKVLFSSQAPTH